jgi:hypothetical protein
MAMLPLGVGIMLDSMDVAYLASLVRRELIALNEGHDYKYAVAQARLSRILNVLEDRLFEELMKKAERQ